MGCNNVKDQILSDAIKTAIEAEKKVEILKRVIYVLAGLLLIMGIAMI